LVMGSLNRPAAGHSRRVFEYRLNWKEGMKRLKTQAKWSETAYPSALASLREGMEETFTIKRLGLPASLRRSLATTNVIASPHAGARRRTNRVSRWRDGAMVVRWTATALVEGEKRFRRIMGYKDQWMLAAYLDGPEANESLASDRKVG